MQITDIECRDIPNLRISGYDLLEDLFGNVAEVLATCSNIRCLSTTHAPKLDAYQPSLVVVSRDVGFV